MTNEIHPVNVGASAGASTKAKMHIDDDNGPEFVLHPVGKDRQVTAYKGDYPT